MRRVLVIIVIIIYVILNDLSTDENIIHQFNMSNKQDQKKARLTPTAPSNSFGTALPGGPLYLARARLGGLYTPAPRTRPHGG